LNYTILIMKLFNTLLLLFMASIPVLAQSIRGKVTGTDGEPLIGASVRLVGTNIGATTNADGAFSLNGDGKSKQLEISYTGYLTQVAQVSAGDINVSLIASDALLDQVVVLGTRANTSRTKTSSPVPVDVINVRDLMATNPLTSVNDVLNYLVPSFNSNRQSASDGTEHIDPASLRGLGPDQVLVLINGKRRHTTSLVNYQNTVGNGSVGTDMNAIPASAIDRIEVLRDGASAQYGSDAIAGVINIILKQDSGFDMNLTTGITSRGDGATNDLNGSYGTKIGTKGGYLNVALQLNQRNATNRTQNHDLVIYDQSALGNFFAYPFTDDPASARAYDDSVMAARGLVRDDFNFRVGDAKIRNAQGFLNFSQPLGSRTELYAFGGIGLRQGQGFGFRRLPSDFGNVVLSIHPNGFQPSLNSNIFDGSMAVGAKIRAGGGIFNVSNTIGTNSFAYTVKNTNNASYGAQSKTEYDAGSHQFTQNTINADYSIYLDGVLSGLNLATGAEFRHEIFNIEAGEPGSYDNGGIDPDGAVGAQSFPGFSPLNALNENRSNVAFYGDAELNATSNLLVVGAIRYENYTDFGNTLNGKLATRYRFADAFSVRAAYSTGFRAPSLQQQYFNNISTDVVDGVLLNSGIFRTDSRIASALGIQPLEEETSNNLSVGITSRIGSNFTLTADVYQIEVDNRIVLTGNLGNDPFGGSIPELQALFATEGAQTGRFFSNAIDTRTRGVDVVATLRNRIGREGRLTSILSFNYNQNEVTALNPLPTPLRGQDDVWYGPQERSLIETNAPLAKGTLQFNLEAGRFNVLVRNTYFGTVARNGFPFGGVQEHEAKVVTDITVGIRLFKQLVFTLGANNLLDVFPDQQIYDNSYFGVFKYAPVQMGTTGAYFFGRLTYRM
jgi:iron complex outermembrane recepter protein